MTEPIVPPVPTTAGEINGEPLDPATGRPAVPPGAGRVVERETEIERVTETEERTVVVDDDSDAEPPAPDAPEPEPAPDDHG
jgi:hypothetical protein